MDQDEQPRHDVVVSRCPSKSMGVPGRKAVLSPSNGKTMSKSAISLFLFPGLDVPARVQALQDCSWSILCHTRCCSSGHICSPKPAGYRVRTPGKHSYGRVQAHRLESPRLPHSRNLRWLSSTTFLSLPLKHTWRQVTPFRARITAHDRLPFRCCTCLATSLASTTA